MVPGHSLGQLGKPGQRLANPEARVLRFLREIGQMASFISKNYCRLSQWFPRQIREITFQSKPREFGEKIFLSNLANEPLYKFKYLKHIRLSTNH